MGHYIAYYDTQVGGGGIEHVFTGSPYQKGHGGIGRFLGGLLRRALPFLKSGARAVGKEALRAGMNIIDDISTQNVPFKQSLRSRVRESGHNLKRKAEEKMESFMEGSGYKRNGKRRKNQSPKKRRLRRSSTKIKRKRLHRTKKKTKKAKSVKRGKKVKRSKKVKKRLVSDIFGPARF